MQFNEALIKHYHESIVPIEKLRTLVNINEAYLRLFSELFFSEFARDIVGLDTIKFDVVHMRTKDSIKKPKEEERKIGLISNNFQVNTNNYYLVSELENPEISSLVAYGGYSLKTLLSFFKDLLATELFILLLCTDCCICG